MALAHMEHMCALCESLGLEHVHKLVIEICVDRPVRFYVVQFPTAEKCNHLIKFVSDVVVTDRAEVQATPLPMSATALMLANAVQAGDMTAAKALADEIVEQCG